MVNGHGAARSRLSGKERRIWTRAAKVLQASADSISGLAWPASHFAMPMYDEMVHFASNMGKMIF